MEVKQFDDEVAQAIKLIADSISAVNQHAIIAENRNHQAFEGLGRSGDDRETFLFREIETVRHEKEKALVLQKDDLEFFLKGVRDVVSFSEQLLKEGGEAVIAGSHKAVTARLETLISEREKMATLLPVIDADIEFEIEEDWVNSLGEAISNVGCITTSQSVCAGKSWIKRRNDHPEITFGWKSIFEVTFANKKGEPLATDESLSTLFLAKVDGPTKELAVNPFLGR